MLREFISWAADLNWQLSCCGSQCELRACFRCTVLNTVPLFTVASAASKEELKAVFKIKFVADHTLQAEEVTSGLRGLYALITSVVDSEDFRPGKTVYERPLPATGMLPCWRNITR